MFLLLRLSVGAALVFSLGAAEFALGATELVAQQREVTGRVLGANAPDGLAGALVSVGAAPAGVITGPDGRFTLQAPAEEVTLRIRMVGYKTEEVTLGPGESGVTVTLDMDVLGLEEVVVTGRATSVARRNLAHSVGTVSSEELERAPSDTFERMLQGKLAGVVIEANSGAPGGGMQVRLRGASTINAESAPLYVVDGVIISNAEIPSNQNAITRAAGGSNPSLRQDAVVNRVADLNPADIERIEVLKGASAAAIYGSKAANGVVVITTKRGQPGAAQLNMTQRLGTFRRSNTLGLRQYASVEEVVSVWGEEAAPLWTGQNFDHERLLAGREDFSFETAVSVSGGSEDTRYHVAGTWSDQAGIIQNTGSERQALRVNLDQRVGSRLDLGFGANVIHTNASRGLTNNDNAGVSYYMALASTPSFLDLRRLEDGTFPDNPFVASNPLQTASLFSNDENVWRGIVSLRSDLEILNDLRHDLRLLGVAGADYFTQRNTLFAPPELQFERTGGQPGTSLLSQSDNLNMNLSASLVHTYSADGGWSATTSAGVQYEDQDLEVNRVISRNLTGGLPKIDAGTNVSVGAHRAQVRDVGYFLQEEVLLLEDRLFLTVGGRADRSSVNGDSDKSFFYPKASASYRIPWSAGALDEMKVRLAWGQSGNRPLFGQKFTALAAGQNVEGLPGLVLEGVAGDANLEPERQNEVEGGVDLELLGGRGALELTVFQKNITNLLLQRRVAPSTGFVEQVFNGGELRSRGVEVALSASPVLNDRVGWVSRVTFFADRSRVMELPVPSFRSGGFGTALGAFEMQEGESATQIVTNIGLDADGNVIVGKVGDANADFRMGFSNDITFGPFQLFGLVDWQRGGTLVNLTKLLFDLAQNTADFTSDPQENESYDGITTSGTTGERRLTRFALGDSRGYMESASFAKLREVSVSYRLPEALVASVLRGAGSAVRISASGRNLVTITDYSGLDPEVSNFGNQPIARNIDVAPFPPSRSFWLSVDVSF